MPGKIDEAQVRHIAMLSRLELTDAEVAEFSHQLSDILAYVEQLNQVDTTDVEPTAHPLPLRNVMREDEPDEPIGVEAALANAPQRAASFFKTPKVIEQDSA
ncbi:MAG: Asp-tRNA(Asn)/Glu-tRNA(Gln) amidotransferase subunit GatC [Phycisphaerae bacterium]|nr:Asp-tRNA(Asn)/Glu-tRNA(Gln) amidotransferase subunit GatC [Phycisphaerae bacterium]